MIRWSLILCATAAVFAAASPAQAYYGVIRWSSGVCQIWDYNLPTRPFPFDYHQMTRPLPTFAAALAAKDRLWHAGRCLL